MTGYIERVKEIVKINALYSLNEDQLWDIFIKTEPIILDGHFELLCEKHTEQFFRFAAISQFPYLLAKISTEMVAWYKNKMGAIKVDVVLAPTSQGMLFAYDMARELNGTMGTRAVYAPCDSSTGWPERELVEGFEIRPNENVLVINDMTTTGNGLDILTKLAEEDYKANVIGICMFANRGVDMPKINTLKSKYEFHSIVDLEMPSWHKEECGAKCHSGRKLIESKNINHMPIYSGEGAYELYEAKLSA